MTSKTTKTKKAAQVMVFDMTSNLCVWSKAGVLRPIKCVNAFDCLNCPMDERMKNEIKAGRLKNGRVLAGRDLYGGIRAVPADEKKCRHMLSGRVSAKYCINDYECNRCEYHQLILDEGLSEPPARPELQAVSGFMMARNCYFHVGHVWARVEYGGRVRVGLDDFAGRLFGPITRFEPPRLGQAVRQGEPGFGFIRDDLDAKCISPLDGIVAAVNPEVRTSGGVMDDPYGRGWIMVLEPRKLKTGLRNLLCMEESLAWMEDEASRLTSMITPESEYQLAATGGLALTDIYGHFPELGWENLKSKFLRT